MRFYNIFYSIHSFINLLKALLYLLRLCFAYGHWSDGINSILLETRYVYFNQVGFVVFCNFLKRFWEFIVFLNRIVRDFGTVWVCHLPRTGLDGTGMDSLNPSIKWQIVPRTSLWKFWSNSLFHSWEFSIFCCLVVCWTHTDHWIELYYSDFI